MPGMWIDGKRATRADCVRAIAGSCAGIAVSSSMNSASKVLNRTQRCHRPRGALRYTLSLRDLAEMFLTRGFVFSYEPARDWEAKWTPALAENLRR